MIHIGFKVSTNINYPARFKKSFIPSGLEFCKYFQAFIQFKIVKVTLLFSFVPSLFLNFHQGSAVDWFGYVQQRAKFFLRKAAFLFDDLLNSSNVSGNHQFQIYKFINTEGINHNWEKISKLLEILLTAARLYLSRNNLQRASIKAVFLYAWKRTPSLPLHWV